MNVIEMQNVHKKYKSITAVQNISLEAKKGEILGLLGANGAGKTTTLEMIEGIVKPDFGEIKVLGSDVSTDDSYKERIGVQFQSTSLNDHLKVGELIKLFDSFYKNHLEEEKLIKEFDLESIINKYYKHLSGGQKQRVSLALATVNDPELIFLDEPSTGLDPVARKSMWKYIKSFKKSGKTVIITTHYMEEAEKLCDRVAFMQNAEILSVGEPKKIINQLKIKSKVTFTKKNAMTISSFENIKEVTTAEEIDSSIVLHTIDADNSISKIYELSVKEGWEIENLHIEHGSLEDVFLQVESMKVENR